MVGVDAAQEADGDADGEPALSSSLGSTSYMQIDCDNNNNSSNNNSCGGSGRNSNSNMAIDTEDEQMRRLLNRKRLSEGNTSRFGLIYHLNRKNSLHMVDATGQSNALPIVTEGEAVQHTALQSASYGDSQANLCGTPGSGSSGSLRIISTSSSSSGKGNNVLIGARRHGSQDDPASLAMMTSCSSSTSLERSPTRRRSSTVSQCSSVLSESARNQLNFDLSPDLPPDVSLLEANALDDDFGDDIRPCCSGGGSHERPASPEPSSLSGDGCVFDGADVMLRSVSRMSTSPPTQARLQSPDSMLGDSNDNSEQQQQQQLEAQQLERLTQSCSMQTHLPKIGARRQYHHHSSSNNNNNKQRPTATRSLASATAQTLQSESPIMNLDMGSNSSNSNSNSNSNVSNKRSNCEDDDYNDEYDDDNDEKRVVDKLITEVSSVLVSGISDDACDASESPVGASSHVNVANRNEASLRYQNDSKPNQRHMRAVAPAMPFAGHSKHPAAFARPRRPTPPLLSSSSSLSSASTDRCSPPMRSEPSAFKWSTAMPTPTQTKK